MARPEIKSTITQHVNFSKKIHDIANINSELIHTLYNMCGKTKSKKVMDNLFKIDRAITSIKSDMECIMFNDNKETIDKIGKSGEPYMSIYYGGMEFRDRAKILEEILKTEAMELDGDARLIDAEEAINCYNG